MATETIFLSLEKGTTNLILTDSQGHHGKDICTDVCPGDKVKWKISNRSRISKITDIYCKSGSPDVFSTKPASYKKGKRWKGVVGDTQHEETESYGIKYIVDGTEYDVDPYIRNSQPTQDG